VLARVSAALVVLLAAALLAPVPALAQTAPAGRVTFPTDALTVPDAAQVTGRRMNLPLPDCTVFKSSCNDVRIINELDGFDLDPRIVIELDAAPDGDLAEVFSEEVAYVEAVDGGERIPLNRLVFDPETTTLYAHPSSQLRESTTYRAVYRDSNVTFTTLTATAGLAQMRRQLDDGSAYEAAGIGEDERDVEFTRDEVSTVFSAARVSRIRRFNEVVPGGDLVEESVLNTALVNAGTIAFPSVKAPSWLDEDRTIPQAPTAGEGPEVTHAEEIGLAVILPNGTPPEGGWPVAIFGPGITRSKYDIFLVADFNAARGIATVGIDPAGHSFGPHSEVAVDTGPTTVRFSGLGRGRDLNHDGRITNQEGVSAPTQPHPKASIALRDGLRQTAADVMTVARAIARGADVSGDGTPDLSQEDISFYALSLGGIYGSMLMGVDPEIQVGVLNVPGGPILDIARLSPAFRANVEDSLRDRIPSLLNGGVNTFTESLPLVLDAPVTEPTDGAVAIQDVFSQVNWINRPGSPEAFAPRITEDPLPDSQAKDVIYQFAFGDTTVPNPTSATLARAFGRLDRVAFYRNDRTATAGSNPHGFLADPRIQGRDQAQAQAVEWIRSDGETFLDPDGPGPTWETPIADIAELETLNFSTELYVDPADAPAREVERHSGDTRIATAAAISAETYESATTVVLARADEYADALAGGPLAAQLQAPLLLSASTELSDATAEEITRLGAESAVLLGGESALGAGVVEDLEEAGLSVRRVSGPNRFATAATIAAELPYTSEVLITEGANPDPTRGWPDALSASGLASGLRQPILLVTRDDLPQETADAIAETQDPTIIGGAAAVSAAVEAELDAVGDEVRRLAGPDRYATSVAVANEAFLRGLSPAVTWTATGRSFADGLVAGAAAGADRGMLLLVDGQSLDGSPAVRDFLDDHGEGFEVVRLAGGTAAISTQTEAQVRDVVQQ
jgi:putative cell wall-binding protein